MIEELSYLQLAWIVFAIFGAYVIRGMSGFGAGLVAAPMLAFVLPLHVVIPTTGLLVFILFIVLTVRDRREVVWSEVRRLVPPTVAGVVSGIFLFRMLDNYVLMMMLGTFLIVYAIYIMGVSTIGLPPFRVSTRWAIPLGFGGSFFDTLFGGGGGALVVIYMHARSFARMQFRATLAMLWFFEMVARVSAYAIDGFYTKRVLILVATLLPVMWLGTWVGEHLGNRVSTDTFSRILAVLLLLSGISLLIKA